jgi:glucose/arabinose dehydrogenase
MPMTDTARFPNAMRPSWNNDQISEGMGPSVFLSGAKWKAWDGRLAVSIMGGGGGGQRIEILQLNAGGMTTATTNMPGLAANRYRSLVLGPDGNLYILAQNAGEIWRVTPN